MHAVLLSAGLTLAGLAACDLSVAENDQLRRNAAATTVPRLRVSPGNRHILETVAGEPVFIVGNMPWLPEQMDASDVETYLDRRESQGHNAVSLAALKFDLPICGGLQPFSSKNPVTLNPAYWQCIDMIVSKAHDHNMYVMMALMWGDDVDTLFPTNTAANNYSYGKLIGARYRGKSNVIFVATGEFVRVLMDSNGNYPNPLPGVFPSDKKNLISQIGLGIKDGCNNENLVTVHGMSGSSHGANLDWVSRNFKNQAWCDFYLEQTHQQYEQINAVMPYAWGQSDPVKPVLLGETGHWERAGSNAALYTFRQRYNNYWAVFHGSIGANYGALWDSSSTMPYLDGSAAVQMKHLAALMRSKPLRDRVPDQDLVPPGSRGSDTVANPTLICATRDTDGDWAFIYSTQGYGIPVVMSLLADGVATAQWMDPRTGVYRPDPQGIGIPSGEGAGNHTFDPPGDPGPYNDWVLVLNIDRGPQGDAVSIITPSDYVVATDLQVADPYYTDRTYALTSIPSEFTSAGEKWIKTANGDKNATGTSFLQFSLSQSSTVYVAYDSRATSLPTWLTSFTPTSMVIGTTDSVGHLDVYRKSFAAGTVALGGNLAIGAGGVFSNYIVIVKSDGSPETPLGHNATISSPSDYVVATDLQVGDPYYTDRPYVLTALPDELLSAGEEWIKTENDDKNATGTSFLQFSLSQSSMVYGSAGHLAPDLARELRAHLHGHRNNGQHGTS